MSVLTESRPRVPWHLLAASCAMAVTAWVHARSLWGAILGWDDRRALTDHRGWRGLGLENVEYAFTATDMGMYRPLTWLSYGFDWARSGMEPFGFHLTNLIVHVAVAGALCLFCVRWLRSLAPGVEPRSAAAIALVASLAFSLHPLRVGAVAWISARADLLAGLFLVLSAIAWLSFVDGRGGTGARVLWHALFAASLLAKPVALGAPIAWWLAQRWWVGRRAVADAPRRTPSLVDLGVGLLFSAAVTWPLLVAKGVTQAASDVPELPRTAAFTAFHNALFPLWKTVWPSGLGFYEPAYPFRPFAWPYLLGAAVAVGLGAIVWALRRKWPGLAVTAGVYLLLLAPMLGVIPFGYELVADRFAYVPALGLSVALLLPLASASRWSPPRAWLLSGALAVALVSLGALAYRQTAIWKDDESFWRHNFSLNPDSALANSGMGDLMLRQGRIAEAKPYYLRTRALLPSYTPVFLGLGFIDLVEGRPHEAIEHLSIYLRERPNNRAAREWIMAAYEQAGRAREAAAVRQMLQLEDELEARRTPPPDDARGR